jgi:hypothetical protein
MVIYQFSQQSDLPRRLRCSGLVFPRFSRLKPGQTLRYRPPMKIDLLSAIDAALAGDWDRAHKTVQQDEDDPLACWIHAVLHKIEGDAGNSRYWYSRSAHSYGEFADPQQELAAIKRELESGR